MPSQSARSRALASAVDSPTTRTFLSVCDEMKFVLDTITSRTGPRSSPEHQRETPQCSFSVSTFRPSPSSGIQETRKCGSLTEQVDLVNDEQRDGLHVAARLPAAADTVPLLRRRHDDVGPRDGADVRRRVAGQLHHSAKRRNTLSQSTRQRADSQGHFRVTTNLKQRFPSQEFVFQELDATHSNTRRQLFPL